MRSNNPCKHLTAILSQLGDPYRIKVIDGENCLYRDLENGIDFEISGLDHNSSTRRANIYIWDTRRGKGIAASTIEMISDVPQDRLKLTLDALADKYSHVDWSAIA